MARCGLRGWRTSHISTPYYVTSFTLPHGTGRLYDARGSGSSRLLQESDTYMHVPRMTTRCLDLPCHDGVRDLLSALWLDRNEHSLKSFARAGDQTGWYGCVHRASLAILPISMRLSSSFIYLPHREPTPASVAVAALEFRALERLPTAFHFWPSTLFQRALCRLYSFPTVRHWALSLLFGACSPGRYAAWTPPTSVIQGPPMLGRCFGWSGLIWLCTAVLYSC